MAQRLVLGILFALSISGGSATAADFDISKINRAILKEPVYQTKAPKYCLLLFGSGAKTLVWLVLDGDTLYVDRNHDGDLTAPDKRFHMKEEKSNGIPEYRTCQVGDLVEADGKTVHRQMQITRCGFKGKGQVDSLWIRIKVKGKYYMATSIEMNGAMDNPASAPIRYFHGPLSFLVVSKTRLFRGSVAEDFGVAIGTYYGGSRPWPHEGRVTTPLRIEQPGSIWAGVQHVEGIPADIHPVAEIVFPPERAGDTPIVTKVSLSRRC